MSCLDTSLPIFTARRSSLNLRLMVRSWDRYNTLMYCWVIVEPPCISPPREMAHAARTIPLTEMPGSVQKVRFSAETTALRRSLGIAL